jgi:GT2 family glycosyltransferase
MNTDKYFKCQLFQKDFNEIDLDYFYFNQEELLFTDFDKNENAKFNVIDTLYKVKFQKSNKLDSNKIPLIIPIHGMPELLEYTLNNLFENDAHLHTNIVVIDDRTPDTEAILGVVNKFDNVSYIRTNYKKSFTYAMIANIAAYIMNGLGFKQIMYWNSDMWVTDKNTIPTLIKKHNEHGSTISGTKLVYPRNHWKTGQLLRNEDKVQFGGCHFERSQVPPRYDIRHFGRWNDIDDPLVCNDTNMAFVTGAYCLVDLEWFIKIGGFNPSLAKVYNDIDICLRANLEKKKVTYFGKETYLIHHESLNLDDKSTPSKFDTQFTSDVVLFNKIYPLQVMIKMLGTAT